jgi:hypothetical protein
MTMNINSKVQKTIMKINRETRQRLKHIARKDKTYDEIVRQRLQCVVANREEAGTIEIRVSAGSYGSVSLYICPKCIT